MLTFGYGMFAAPATLWQLPVVLLCSPDVTANKIQYVGSHEEYNRLVREE